MSHITRFLRFIVASGMAPSAVACWRTAGGDFNVEAYGVACVSPAKAATPSTLYDLASLTKPLAITTLFLQAMEKGLVGLQDRVERHLDRFHGSVVGSLTLEQLFTHTSGLPAWLPLYELAGGRRGRVWDALRGLELEFAPGEKVIYSCVGFVLLGLVLEEVLGASLRLLFRERVAVPLGLEGRIGFGLGDRQVACGASVGAEPGAGSSPHYPGGWLPDDANARFLGGVAGNSGLVGDAEAVARLAWEYASPRPVIFGRESAALATRNWTEGLEQDRGLGWQLASTRGCSAGRWLAPSAFGHTGFTGTSVWVEAERGIVAVLLANRHHPAHRGVDLHPARRAFHRLVVSGGS